MIEKNIGALTAHFRTVLTKGYMDTKAYKTISAVFPSMLSSMAQDEDILYAFSCESLIKNHGRESATLVLNIITTRKYYFSGVDGRSSIFFPQPKSGSVDLKDVHAVTMGKRYLGDPYISFETKNEDYQLVFVHGKNINPIKAYLDEAIKIAHEASSNNTLVQKTSSPADEIKKFKELLDLGIITQEEFDTKKKQLLGL